MTEEATVNPDGSTTFESDETFNTTAEEDTIFVEEEVVKGIDPAIYLGLVLLALGLLWFFVLRSQNKEEDEFFAELDVEKVRVIRFGAERSLQRSKHQRNMRVRLFSAHNEVSIM